MNSTLTLLLNRKSVRSYAKKKIDEKVKEQIIAAVLRAPTAGNMMLYTIIEVKRQEAKETLVRTCDHQPFIAKAPLVLLFLADYQRWFDYFCMSDVDTFCANKGKTLRKPQEGDLFLACCDALIAAHTAVIAAASLGIGSCYIGDIMENYEEHKTLFQLPEYVFPISLVCFGYPTGQQQKRPLTSRFDKKFVMFEDRYRRFGKEALIEMFRERQEKEFNGRRMLNGTRNLAQMMYQRKFDSAFALEMNRSVRAMLRAWREE